MVRADHAAQAASIAPSTPAPARLRWAALIRKVYEVDPLLCPKCGGTMKVIAFIDDDAVIRKILDHLGLSLSSGTDPPHAHSPPPEVTAGSASPTPQVPMSPTSAAPFMDDLPWGEHADAG